MSELGAGVGERDELVLCEHVLTDRFGDLCCGGARGMGGGHAGVGWIYVGGVVADVTEIRIGKDQSDPAKIRVGGTGNGHCLFTDGGLKLCHGGESWLSSGGAGHFGHLVQRNLERFGDIARGQLGVTHCNGRLCSSGIV